MQHLFGICTVLPKIGLHAQSRVMHIAVTNVSIDHRKSCFSV